MKSVYDTIIAIRGTSSKNEKLAILQAQKGNEELREFLRVVFEPRINFYMKKIDTSIKGIVDATPVMGLTLVGALVENLGKRLISGNAAKVYVANIYNSLATNWERELLVMLIERDVKAGFSESTTNKVWPGLITEVPYMRCSLPKDAKLDKFPWKAGVYSQVKADGMFANVNHNLDGSVTVESRNGSPFPIDQFGPLVDDIRARIPIGTQLHGELLMHDPTGNLTRQASNGILNRVLQGGEIPEDHIICFYAWDAIPAAAAKDGVFKSGYTTRFEWLRSLGLGNLLALKLIETEIVHSFIDANAHYRDALGRGLEGTIIKHPDMPWKDGTSKLQVKMKVEFEVDLEVIGYNEGRNKYEGTLGSLECASSCGQLIVNVAGFTDDQRNDIWARKNLKIVTVKANSIMPPDRKTYFSLFLPIFVEERLDKKVADDLTRIQEQFDAVTSLL